MLTYADGRMLTYADVCQFIDDLRSHRAQHLRVYDTPPDALGLMGAELVRLAARDLNTHAGSLRPHILVA